MGLAPYENLKGFASSRPPLVVFMICLGAFAVVLLSLAYYVKLNNVRNPDVTQDWNAFLESFAELEFCITGSSSEVVSTVAPPSTGGRTSPTTAASTAATTEDSTTAAQLDYDGPRNYSVSMLLNIQPTQEFLSIHHNVTMLTGAIYGSQLGLQGPIGDEIINVTTEIPVEWNNTKCSSHGGCETVQVYACIHFQAATPVFPKSQSPPQCEGLNETGVEYHARMTGHKAITHPQMLTTYYCRSHPVIKVRYKFNPTLAVWLSLRDRSVINLHLMHTSYFLFVMVVTLLCYAVVRGRPNKGKVTQSDRVPLASQT